ncbi:hypothetical protein L3Y34_002127 [Caenorhabditis briggsae]|uniref:C2H2-type domain-containing protein n=1 Tax=Caenorhabditis briggsae TaxID=6238 RepID=A0AAE9DDX6_CAEBR|nr:hypothetical protein L3Y34_002127 [Caenorhabditis briggsae]
MENMDSADFRYPKTYNCPTCGRAFVRRGAMVRHIGLIHGDDRVEFYNCNLCSSTFTAESRLKRHQQTKHHASKTTSRKTIQLEASEVDGKYHCLHCENSCVTRNGLIRHINRCHSDMNPRDVENDINEAAASPTPQFSSNALQILLNLQNSMPAKETPKKKSFRVEDLIDIN